MKLRNIIIPALFGIIGLGAIYPQSDNKEKEALILHAVMEYLINLHIEPRNVDDNFATKVFDNYIDALDPGKRFFTQTEIDELSAYKTNIDDEIENKTFEFFDRSIELIDVSVDRAENIFKDLKSHSFDLALDESIQIDSDKRDFSKSDSELKDIWRKMMKYDLIGRLDSKLDAQKDSTVQKTKEELKGEALEAIVENYEDWFKRIRKLRREDRFESYINSITHIYDPHSDYFNPKEKEDFDIRMGGKLEGIGARLSTDGDYTKIVSIIPGGPAWKGKVLEVNDLITAVRQEKGETVDITGMRLDDVVQKIRGDKGTIVILTVKKPDGTISDIEIERDEVIIDEGFARSMILNMEEEVENIGYIKLPKFYSSFEGKDGNSCAKDVAVEVEKLKKKNVNGIILDLRNNGGGSLRDVISMSGLFIEDGPIVQVKPRAKDPYVYDDEDARVQYNGPLIVMVNQFSASASEILAAALQDYDRAVIVGSNSTFGKGTVQRFADLDKAIAGNNELKPLGQLKITMQKFYRVDGRSTQLRGVTPDIILPDPYHFVETGEKEYDFPLQWSEIDPVKFGQDVYVLSAKKDIISKSSERVNSNETFKYALENAERLKEAREDTEYPLSLEQFRAVMDEREEESKKYEELLDVEIESIEPMNLDVDLAIIQSDESRTARNEDWIESIKKDFYLEETMRIMSDIQQLNN